MMWRAMEVEQRKISRAVISRLPRYYRYLGDLLEAGVERISSNDLSKKMQVTASQIRQDLNNFGGFGQQGYGYNVQYLYDEIGKILGVNTTHPMIIIGGGNFGHALANYDFSKNGFITKAILKSCICRPIRSATGLARRNSRTDFLNSKKACVC